MFDAIALSKYGGVYAALILAGCGMPVPEEVPIVTAGALVGHDAQELKYHNDLAGAIAGGPVAYLKPQPVGLVRWWIMLPVCIVGVVMSDSVLYAAGRFWGPRLQRWRWFQKYILPPDKQAAIEANFAKNGILILLGARFAPGIRTPVFLMAGMLRMPLSRFLLADGLYAIPGVNLLFWLAYWFTDQFVEAVQAVDRHRPMAIAVILAGVGGMLVYKLLINRKLSTGDMGEIPTIVKPVGAVTHAVEQTIEMAVGRTVHTAARVVDVVTHPLGHGPKPPTANPTTPASGTVPHPVRDDQPPASNKPV